MAVVMVVVVMACFRVGRVVTVARLVLVTVTVFVFVFVFVMVIAVIATGADVAG